MEFKPTHHHITTLLSRGVKGEALPLQDVRVKGFGLLIRTNAQVTHTNLTETIGRLDVVDPIHC